MSFIEKFKKYFDTNEKGCWIWKFSLYGNGYGQFAHHGKKYLAHRVSWMLHRGKIPRNLCICHKCDVRNCVNPSHLFVGTRKENMQDMINKNRGSTGDKNGSSKLKTEDILRIRKMHIENKINAVKLSDIFKISATHIRSILHGKEWKHLISGSIKLPYRQDGELNNNNRLNRKIITQIRSLKGIKTPKEISALYRISEMYVYSIWNNRVWKNV